MTSRSSGIVESAAISDRYEIEAARIALKRTGSQAIRNTAQTMIDDQQANSRKLKSAVAASAKVDESDLPSPLDTRRSTMIDHLKEAPADKFDKTYVDQQTLAHEEAVSLLHNYRDDGDCPRLRGFARDASPIIEDDLQRMKQLRSQIQDPRRAAARGAALR